METKKYCLNNEIKDKLNWKIPKGSLIYILKELKNPQLENEFIISVDNGTGLKETYPKTLITEKELERGLN